MSDENKLYECTCNCCDRKYDEVEFLVTNDKNKCILHCEKIIDNSEVNKYFWNELSIYIFNKTNEISHPNIKEVKNQIEKEYNFDMYKYVFNEVVFPSFNFMDNDNKFIFDGLSKDINIYFNNCFFLGNIDFSLLNKSKNVNFTSCTFYSNIEFNYQEFEYMFLFENCILEKDLIFRNIVFNNMASFINTIVIGEMKLIHTKFYSLALFNDFFTKEFLLDNTFFKDEVNFLNISENVKDRETARVIKDSFEKQNNIIEANKFYTLEMKEREKELEKDRKEGKNYFEWLVFKIHGLSSNHSQDWVRTLFWIITVGLIASLFNFYSIKDETGTFINLTFSSIIGFVLLVFFAIYVNKIFKIPINIEYGFLLFNFYLIYIYKTNDVFLTEFAKIFSLIKNTNDIPFIGLIFKIIIAYLIYQFVISIRQNTRRK